MRLSPLVKYANETIALPLRYFGSIGYYATLAAHANVVIDCQERYDKRKKETHRCVIADTHGALKMTVPITKPEKISQLTWNDIKVAPHGQWWNVHYMALCSAYGRSPFFEFYIDRFLPFFQNHDISLVDLDVSIDSEIRDILGIDSNVSYKIGNNYDYIKDYRDKDFGSITIATYHQLRQAEYGFISNISILDLIFNMGKEAPLILKKTINLNQFV